VLIRWREGLFRRRYKGYVVEVTGVVSCMGGHGKPVNNVPDCAWSQGTGPGTPFTPQSIMDELGATKLHWVCGRMQQLRSLLF
jgi:hypothetical protein